MTSPRIGELPALSEAMAGELRGVVQGELVLPGDAAYDEARRAARASRGRFALGRHRDALVSRLWPTRHRGARR